MYIEKRTLFWRLEGRYRPKRVGLRQVMRFILRAHSITTLFSYSQLHWEYVSRCVHFVSKYYYTIIVRLTCKSKILCLTALTFPLRCRCFFADSMRTPARAFPEIINYLNLNMFYKNKKKANLAQWWGWSGCARLSGSDIFLIYFWCILAIEFVHIQVRKTRLKNQKLCKSHIEQRRTVRHIDQHLRASGTLDLDLHFFYSDELPTPGTFMNRLHVPHERNAWEKDTTIAHSSLLVPERVTVPGCCSPQPRLIPSSGGTWIWHAKRRTCPGSSFSRWNLIFNPFLMLSTTSKRYHNSESVRTS